MDTTIKITIPAIHFYIAPVLLLLLGMVFGVIYLSTLRTFHLLGLLISLLEDKGFLEALESCLSEHKPESK